MHPLSSPPGCVLRVTNAPLMALSLSGASGGSGILLPSLR
jgi:hypothetical protein